MIMDKAREHGAAVMEETKARNLIKSPDGKVEGVKVLSKDLGELELRAPIVVDASGRDCFAAHKENWMVRDPELKKVALWTYYKNAKRDPGLDEGATTVAYLPDKGWFWYIPLSGDMVSVGIVAERDYLFNGSTKDHAEIFQREVENNEWIKEHLAEGEQTGEYRITGEYSYRNRYCATDGLVLAGDALGFLDPVFSSGVFLALKSGVMLADEIDLALQSGQPVTSNSFEKYGKRMQSSIETMRKIVYAFYDPDFSFGDLVKRGDHLRAALTDCLIGNVDDQDFQELFDSMSDLAKLPEPVEHGLAQASS
jgi:flavin-dependent dehydrogenase